jgi:hypothetical protein
MSIDLGFSNLFLFGTKHSPSKDLGSFYLDRIGKPKFSSSITFFSSKMAGHSNNLAERSHYYFTFYLFSVKRTKRYASSPV